MAFSVASSTYRASFAFFGGPIGVNGLLRVEEVVILSFGGPLVQATQCRERSVASVASDPVYTRRLPSWQLDSN